VARSGVRGDRISIFAPLEFAPQNRRTGFYREVDREPTEIVAFGGAPEDVFGDEVRLNHARIRLRVRAQQTTGCSRKSVSSGRAIRGRRGYAISRVGSAGRALRATFA
jgi:hypothetical protein